MFLTATALAALPSGGSQQVVELPVLESLSASDGTAEFRAYLVEWNCQPVAVTDPRGNTNLRSDDRLSVLVMKSPDIHGNVGGLAVFDATRLYPHSTDGAPCRWASNHAAASALALPAAAAGRRRG